MLTNLQTWVEGEPVKGKPAKPSRATALQLLQQLLQDRVDHKQPPQMLNLGDLQLESCQSVGDPNRQDDLSVEDEHADSGEQPVSDPVDAAALPAIVVKAADAQNWTLSFQQRVTRAASGGVTASVRDATAPQFELHLKSKKHRHKVRKAPQDVLLLTEKQHLRMQQQADDQTRPGLSDALDQQQLHVSVADKSDDASWGEHAADEGQHAQQVQIGLSSPVAECDTSAGGTAGGRAGSTARGTAGSTAGHAAGGTADSTTDSTACRTAGDTACSTAQVSQREHLVESAQGMHRPQQQPRQAQQQPDLSLQHVNSSEQSIDPAQQQSEESEQQHETSLQCCQSCHMQQSSPVQLSVTAVQQHEACQQPCGSSQRQHELSQQPYRVGQQQHKLSQQSREVSQEPQGLSQQPQETSQEPHNLSEQPCGLSQQTHEVHQASHGVSQQHPGIQEQDLHGERPDKFLWQRLHDCLTDTQSANKLANCTVTLLVRM